MSGFTQNRPSTADVDAFGRQRTGQFTTGTAPPVLIRRSSSDDLFAAPTTADGDSARRIAALERQLADLRERVGMRAHEQLLGLVDSVKTLSDSPACRDLPSRNREALAEALDHIAAVQSVMLQMLRSVEGHLTFVVEDLHGFLFQLQAHREAANAATDPDHSWPQHFSTLKGDSSASSLTNLMEGFSASSQTPPFASCASASAELLEAELRPLHRIAAALGPLSAAMQALTADGRDGALLLTHKDFMPSFGNLQAMLNNATEALGAAGTHLAKLALEHGRKPAVALRDEAARLISSVQHQLRDAHSGAANGAAARAARAAFDQLSVLAQDINKCLTACAVAPLPRVMPPWETLDVVNPFMRSPSARRGSIAAAAAALAPLVILPQPQQPQDGLWPMIDGPMKRERPESGETFVNFGMPAASSPVAQQPPPFDALPTAAPQGGRGRPLPPVNAADDIAYTGDAENEGGVDGVEESEDGLPTRRRRTITNLFGLIG